MKINIVKTDNNCFVPADEDSEKKFNRIGAGEIFNVDIRKVEKRSLEQNNLFWKCCTIVAENTEDRNWNTKRKVCDQCLIDQKLIEYWTQYNNPKTNKIMLNLKLKSVSFENMEHLDACDFFTKAFDYMASKIGITSDELIYQATCGMLGVPAKFKGDIYPASNI